MQVSSLTDVETEPVLQNYNLPYVQENSYMNLAIWIAAYQKQQASTELKSSRADKWYFTSILK